MYFEGRKIELSNPGNDDTVSAATAAHERIQGQFGFYYLANIYSPTHVSNALLAGIVGGVGGKHCYLW